MNRNGRPPAHPVTFTFDRRVKVATDSGRLGPEHENVIAIGRRLAVAIDDDETAAPALPAFVRELLGVLGLLGLAPGGSAPGELEQLLAELRGDDT